MKNIRKWLLIDQISSMVLFTIVFLSYVWNVIVINEKLKIFGEFLCLIKLYAKNHVNSKAFRNLIFRSKIYSNNWKLKTQFFFQFLIYGIFQNVSIREKYTPMVNV